MVADINRRVEEEEEGCFMNASLPFYLFLYAASLRPSPRHVHVSSRYVDKIEDIMRGTRDRGAGTDRSETRTMTPSSFTPSSHSSSQASPRRRTSPRPARPPRVKWLKAKLDTRARHVRGRLSVWSAVRYHYVRTWHNYLEISLKIFQNQSWFLKFIGWFRRFLQMRRPNCRAGAPEVWRCGRLVIGVVSTRSRLSTLEGWRLSHLPAGLSLLRMSGKQSPYRCCLMLLYWLLFTWGRLGTAFRGNSLHIIIWIQSLSFSHSAPFSFFLS